MPSDIEQRLFTFQKIQRFRGKGPLCVALVVTRTARNSGLPIDAGSLVTEGRGQVKGLGKSQVQSILKEYGIERTLAEEGGRTSRGSLGNMETYVSFLNSLDSEFEIDIEDIESWWVERVKDFFASRPFRLSYDPSRSMRAVVRDLFAQARTRQSGTTGATFEGTMLQHLVGAKLQLLVDQEIEHHGASVADSSTHRDADFTLEDVAIHVTTAPSEALIHKCKRNLEAGIKPLVITTRKGVVVAETVAEQMGIVDRIDCFEAEQFIAGNLYELGGFSQTQRRETANRLIETYNRIVESCETDPSLRIEPNS